MSPQVSYFYHNQRLQVHLFHQHHLENHSHFLLHILPALLVLHPRDYSPPHNPQAPRHHSHPRPADYPVDHNHRHH